MDSLDRCLNGRFLIIGEVYNIKPYLEFHPGGVDEIMRGAGKDATQLFNEVCHNVHS